MKADRLSTDALISYVRVANIDLNIETVKVLSCFDMVCAMSVTCHGKAWLTLKHRETHGCVVSTVATDALVLKHQAISIHNAD